MSDQPRNLTSFEKAEVTANAIWSAEQEYFYIECMKRKLNQNPNRQTCAFSKEEWKQLRLELFNKFGVKYDNKQIKNKYHHLKQRYQTFKKVLVACSGQGWDPILGTITALDSWWEEHLKTNSQAKKFRRTGCPEYNSLCVVFGDTATEGALTALHKYGAINSTSREQSDENVKAPNASDHPEFEDSGSESIPSTPMPSTPLEGNPLAYEPMNSDANHLQVGSFRPYSCSRPQTPAPSHHRKKRKVCEISEAINAFVAAINKREARKEKFSIEAAMQVLDSMNLDLDDQSYLEVMDKFNDQGWRESFIIMPQQRRLAAVKLLLGNL